MWWDRRFLSRGHMNGHMDDSLIGICVKHMVSQPAAAAAALCMIHVVKDSIKLSSKAEIDESQRSDHAVQRPED